MGDARALQARVEELETRVRELEAEQELHELRAIVEAQEAALTEQRRIIESQSALIEDLNEHLSTGLPSAEKENEKIENRNEKPLSRDDERDERGQPPLPPPARRSRGSSGSENGTTQGAAPKKRSGNATSSGYGRVSTGGSMSAPGLRSGKLEVRKEKSERNERNEKRLGGSSASSGGLGIKGPSPRMTPRSASASDARRGHGSNGAMAVGVPPSLPLLRQEA